MRRHKSIGGLAGASAIVAAFIAIAVCAIAATDENAACRPYFHSACSEALGRWLPRLPNATVVRAPGFKATRTNVEDHFVDPSGKGEAGFLGVAGVYAGSLFVYGTAGPPKGHVVYDPVHRIAYYDEGCCAWHHAALVGGAPPPPKRIAARSLLGIRTARGIALGDSMADVRAVFGFAPARVVEGTTQATLVYVRDVVWAQRNPPCTETTTFLFTSDTLRAMDFGTAC